MVELSVPAEDAAFLRRTFEAARLFLHSELHQPTTVSLRNTLLREDEAFAELLKALDTGEIDPEVDIKVVLADLINAIDRENEYRRVNQEHEALANLLRQMPVVELREWQA